jgi:sugar (pentulose or hexulose) kinase
LDRHGRWADLPIIAWFDPRGGEEFQALDPAFLAAFPAQAGLPVSPVATFAKLLWMRRELGFDLTGHRWLNVPEFVIHAFGGEPVSEPSLASRTGQFDQDEMTPFWDALAVLDTTEDLLPPLVPAGTDLGTASASVPAWLRGATLTVAGHDHPVASLAAGATGPDDLFDSCGTAEALVRATTRRITPEERTELSRHNVCQGAHVLPGRRMLLGGTRGGLLLRRILAMLGATEPAAREALDAACPTGEVSLPVHIDGGRLDEQAVWLRIDSDDASPPLVWRAALEVVAEQARAMVDIFEGVAGPAERMIAAGGWTGASSYRAIKERTCPGIQFADLEQAGGLGAAAVASFAATGTGRIDDLPGAIERFIG